MSLQADDDKSVNNLPLELIAEIAKFLNGREFHEWMLLSRKVFERFSSDACYSFFYWRELKNMPQVYNNPSNSVENDSLYSKYKQITCNFRQNLIEFKKEATNNRKHFEFKPIETLSSISTNSDKILQRTDFGKVVFVGNGGVGKKSLIYRMYTGQFTLEYYPWYAHDIATIQYKKFSCHLWNTAGQDDYDRLRPLSYPGTHLFVLCFSLIDKGSFKSITEKWIPELRHHLKDTPIILLGCKQDVREEIILSESRSDLERCINSYEAEELAKYLGCISYWECSSKTGTGLENVVQIIVNGCLIGKEQLRGKSVGSRKCFIQ